MKKAQRIPSSNLMPSLAAPVTRSALSATRLAPTAGVTQSAEDWFDHKMGIRPFASGEGVEQSRTHMDDLRGHPNPFAAGEGVEQSMFAMSTYHPFPFAGGEGVEQS